MPSLPDELRVGPPPPPPGLAQRLTARLKWTVLSAARDLLVTLELAVRSRRPTGPDGRGEGCRILVIDDAVPDPLFGFGFPRMFEIVTALARAGHRVTMYPLRSEPHDLRRLNELCAGLVRFVPGEGVRGLRRLLRRDGSSLDLVLVSRPDPMSALREAGWRHAGHKPFVAYDMEAVTTPREATRRQLFSQAWTSREEADVLAKEVGVAAGADAVVAVTQVDRSLIANHLDLPGLVISYPCRFAPSTARFAARKDLLFVGRMTGSAAHYPNVDAVAWLVREVMPRLDGLLGKPYRLHLVGSFDQEATALASDRVILHGAVDDIARFYEECRVFVAPTRYAAGVPIKVIETIGRGLPAVVTPLLAGQIGGEGHGFTHDPSAAAFAAACARLYTDEESWQSARDYGLALAQQRFSQASFDRALGELVDRARAYAGTGRNSAAPSGHASGARTRRRR